MRSSKAIIILFIILANQALAEEVWTAETFIKNITTLVDQSNGDVILSVQIPAIGCSAGFWLPRTSPGFTSNLSAALSAYHTKSKVQLFGDNAVRWSGSSGEYCKLTRITYL